MARMIVETFYLFYAVTLGAALAGFVVFILSEFARREQK